MASIIGVETLQHTNGTTAATIDSGGRLIGSKAGSIIQIQYDQYTSASTQSISSQTYTELDNLSVDITPTSTSSVIKVEAQIFHEPNNVTSEYNNVFFFYRGSTKLGHATAGNRPVGIASSVAGFYSNDSGSTPSMAYLTFYDTPSTTSQITYKVGVWYFTAVTFALNRSATDTNDADYERGTSFISVTEIAG